MEVSRNKGQGVPRAGRAGVVWYYLETWISRRWIVPSGKIKLDAVGCCALAHAFLRNPAQVNRWAQFTGPLQMLAEIFSGNTSNLEFIPNEQTVMIYRAFAKIEIQRLADHADGRLRCRHGVEAHVDALIRLLSCLPADTSN